MKSNLIIIALFAIFCVSVNAQDSSKYALTFGIDNNFKLTNFDMDIAIKKIIDKTHQLRLFISPRINTNNREDKTTEGSQTVENKKAYYSLGLGADYIWILMNNKDIEMFGGSGLAFRYGNNYQESISTNELGDKSTTEEKNPLFELGLRGNIGVEWRVSDKIGIHSEYLLTCSYQWSKQEINVSSNKGDSRTVTRRSSGISLSSRVLFGLSVYL